MKTCHSETGRLLSVYLNPVQNSWRSPHKINREWKELNYLSAPDFDKSTAEYEHFAGIFRDNGVEVIPFTGANETTIDAIYCRDASIATDQGIIICRMGKDQRKPEAAMQEEQFHRNGLAILGKIRAPGTLEGGDTAWLDRMTLAVGRSYRTNREGINQLRKLLEPLGVTVITADLPHYRGASDVFHLMSILSPVDQDLAVVYSPLMPITFRESLIQRGFQLVEVPDEEFASMGCNVLAIGPRTCVMAEGNPITRKALEKAGCRVICYPGAEISIKGGGGPTCLTRPLQREL